MSREFFFQPELETLDRASLEGRQRQQLARMLAVVARDNRFYRDKLERAGWREGDGFEGLPLTTRAELQADARENPPYGSNLTFPLSDYVRLHQTSGTTGEPLVVLDTRKSWHNWQRCWGLIFRAAGVQPGERVYVAFGFGPFIAFWPPFEAGPDLGLLVLPGGAQSSRQRLQGILKHRATVLLSTPSYALHLAEVAREQGIDPASSPVRTTIHAGEPGASIPSTRKRIEQAWGARCFDHIGASEIGPWGFECHVRPGAVHVNELDYMAECINPETLQPSAPGETGELVLTNLNRWGFPVVRYRSGDLAQFLPAGRCDCGRWFRLLKGGIISRLDDMFIIRGVNVFPTAVEAVVREFREIVEFEATISTRREMDDMSLRVETDCGSGESESICRRLGEELQARLGLRIDVEPAEPGTLPRYELKAKRFKRV